MALPHPLDYEWRPFTGAYYKLFYDVKMPDGTVYAQLWPNGGLFRAYVDDPRSQFRKNKRKLEILIDEKSSAMMRVSPEHPMGGEQLTEQTRQRMLSLYALE